MRSNCLHSLLCLFIKVLSQEMSQSFHMVVAIDDSKETFKLAVRIVDLQFVQAREKSRHLEMVLMDGKICCDLVFSLFNNVIGFMLCFVVVQRDRIHVIVKKEDLKNWEVELKEGKTYYMYNFRVVPNDGQYKVCAHPFKLFFTGGTTLRQVDLAEIPLKSFEFKSFEDIDTGNYDPNMLIGELVLVLSKLVFSYLIFTDHHSFNF